MLVKPAYGFALLLAVTFAVYGGTFYAPFVFDDAHYITGNPSVNFTEPIHLSNARSLSLFTYRLNYWVSQDRPFGYHVVNLGIHLLNGWLVWQLATLLLSESGALFAAGLFLLHPLQSQAVIYLSGRTELLATLGILASMLAFMRSRWLWAVLFAMLGMMSKETALVIPILWACWVIYRGEVRRLLIGIWACGIALLFVLLNPTLPTHLTRISTNFAGIPEQCAAVWILASRFILPVGFTLDHDFSGIPVYWTLAALIAFGALIPLAIHYRRTVFGFGLAWFVVLMGLRIIAGPEGYLAEHHFYAAFAGMAVLVTSLFKETHETSRIPKTALERERIHRNPAPRLG